jgi:hypothetical protein
MSQETFNQLMGSIMQGMSLHLMELATGDEGPKEVQTRRSGDLSHLRIKNERGEVLFQVSGKDTGALAWQLVLTCLHKISIDELKLMHKRPLRRALQLTPGNDLTSAG